MAACKKNQPSQTIVHAQLEMTKPGDADENEANAMADAIVSGGKIRRQISGGTAGSGIAVSTAMESQLAQAQGGGRTMPDGLRNMMENGFGRDFSDVRIHTDSQAAEMSSNLSAKAFTLGNDIYFNKGQFSPSTTSGQHLIAHELTHVVQGSGKVGREPNPEQDLRDDIMFLNMFPTAFVDYCVRKYAYHPNSQSLIDKENKDLYRRPNVLPFIGEKNEDENPTELRYIPGRGAWIAPKKSLDIMDRNAKNEAFLETMDLMRQGLGACFGVMSSDGDIYDQLNRARLGGAIDAMYTNQYGMKGNRSSSSKIGKFFFPVEAVMPNSSKPEISPKPSHIGTETISSRTSSQNTHESVSSMSMSEFMNYSQNQREISKRIERMVEFRDSINDPIVIESIQYKIEYAKKQLEAEHKRYEEFMKACFLPIDYSPKIK